MKALTEEQQINLMQNVIEPTFNRISPDSMITSITLALKEYMNSPTFDKDDNEARTYMISGISTVIDMLNDIQTWYED